MNKSEFLSELSARPQKMPQADARATLSYYGEMLDDRIEEGLTEEAAVASVGTPSDIAAALLKEMPLAKIIGEAIKPKRKLSVLEIILLVLGSPIWISLIVAAFAVLFSLYVSAWSVVISLWACVVSFAACAVVGVLCLPYYAVLGNLGGGLFLCGAGVALAGLAVFFAALCKLLTVLTVRFTRRIPYYIKRCFVGKEALQ